MILSVARFREATRTHMSGTTLLIMLEDVRLPTDGDGNLRNTETLRNLFRAAIKQAPEPVKTKCAKMLEFLQSYD